MTDEEIYLKYRDELIRYVTVLVGPSDAEEVLSSVVTRIYRSTRSLAAIESPRPTVGDCTGPSTLTNDGGTWEGTCEGTTTWSTTEPDHVHSIDCTYLGAGAYAGLRFREHLEDVDFPWSITGVVESAA